MMSKWGGQLKTGTNTMLQLGININFFQRIYRLSYANILESLKDALNYDELLLLLDILALKISRLFGMSDFSECLSTFNKHLSNVQSSAPRAFLASAKLFSWKFRL